LRSISFEKLPSVYVEDPTSDIDTLYKAVFAMNSKRPGWSGTMQMIHKGDHPGKASVLFLPMLDINPSDLTCIYSTLNFICAHAKQYEVTPVVTFDQPLWWKALQIIESEPEASEL
ncbi:MAG: hypothetical protein ABW185_03020, partial [Sedimenticola sp.]